MVIGCVRLIDVSVIDTLRSSENREKVWWWASCMEHTRGVQ